jgi:hypothetical protein
MHRAFALLILAAMVCSADTAKIDTTGERGPALLASAGAGYESVTLAQIAEPDTTTAIDLRPRRTRSTLLEGSFVGLLLSATAFLALGIAATH